MLVLEAAGLFLLFKGINAGPPSLLKSDPAATREAVTQSLIGSVPLVFAATIIAAFRRYLPALVVFMPAPVVAAIMSSSDLGEGLVAVPVLALLALASVVAIGKTFEKPIRREA